MTEAADTFASARPAGVLLEARHLHKRLRSGEDLLHDISIRIEPSELVVIAGLSGAGKTTLLDALSCYRPATSGEVLVDGVDLYENFDAFRTSIGFVPQREIMHMDLTVREALDYSARLRMPPETSAETRASRVHEVLVTLDLLEREAVRVRDLSGGQQKRVSIGVELVTNPHLFFLDEPTSGLDPSAESDLLRLLRRLADQGRTIVLVTHSAKVIGAADKLLFLARGGHLAWYGPPADALVYFNGYRSPSQRAAGPLEFDGVYALVDDPAAGSADAWAERYAAIAGSYAEREGAARKHSGHEPPRPQHAGPIEQFRILSARNMKLLARDRAGLVLMLAAPPILTLMVVVLTYRGMFDATEGNATRIAISFSLLIFLAMAIGAMSFMREVVKETAVYKRERHVTLKIFPYVLSKVWVVVLFALYQGLAWFIGLYLFVDMPGGADTAFDIFLFLFLATLVGMTLGLLASALSPSEGAAPLLTAMFVMPQIMFSGALLPLTQIGPVGAAITSVMPARFAFEGLVSASGYGWSVAQDPDWQLPTAQRLALTDGQKSRDACMGDNIFSECDFPGIRAFWNLGLMMPLPRAPVCPCGDRLSTSARIDYLHALLAYKDKLAFWTRLHDRVIDGAEARIAIDRDMFGPIYDADIRVRILALLLTVIVIVFALAGVQRAKDVVRSGF